MKKVISLFLCFTLLFLTGGTVLADDGTTKSESESIRSAFPTTQYQWVIDRTVAAGTKASGSWVLFYDGEPAGADGEYDSITASTSYSHTFSGSFATGILKGLAEAELGFSFGTQESFSVTKNSASLNKGDYVKGYWRKNYKLFDVYQKELVIKYPDSVEETGDTKVTTAQKAIQPKLKLEYYNKYGERIHNRNLRSSELKVEPYKVEYYEVINGQYVKVYEERNY